MLTIKVIRFLDSLGYGLIVREHLHCDVMAIRPHSQGILSAEIELSVRNLMKNCARDFAVGCTHVLIVSPDFKTTGEIARKLDRELRPELWENVGVITTSALRMLAPAQQQNGGTK